MTSDHQEEEELARRWYDEKTALMEKSLGPEHGIVMHSIIPYAVGGGLDLYYFAEGMKGTAIATKELSELPNEGSSNEVYCSYELVMFTKHPLQLDLAQNEETDFGRVHSTINSILNCIAPYSTTAILNPDETCEFPEEMERIGGKSVIFDGYACHSAGLVQDFGLLAVIEVFRSEMEFARRKGGAKLIKRLKSKGHYPYSDLDRDPVA
jgi:hypothetical protein